MSVWRGASSELSPWKKSWNWVAWGFLRAHAPVFFITHGASMCARRQLFAASSPDIPRTKTPLHCPESASAALPTLGLAITLIELLSGFKPVPPNRESDRVLLPNNPRLDHAHVCFSTASQPGRGKQPWRAWSAGLIRARHEFPLSLPSLSPVLAHMHVLPPVPAKRPDTDA